MRVLIGTAALRQAVRQTEALRTELERTEGDLGVAVREAMQARAQVAEYENALTWDTTCLNCSKLLDECYSEHSRAERAEHRLGSLHQEMLGGELFEVGFEDGERFNDMRRWIGMRLSVIVIAEALLEQFGPKDKVAGDWRDYELEAEAILASQAKA